MEKIKKYLPYIALGATGVAFILLLIFGFVNVHTPVKIMLFICAGFVAVLAGLVALYFFVFGEKKKNYFLTDKSTGRNKRVRDLTFEDVNDRMNYFMAKRVTDERELWLGGFLGKRGLFGVDDVFKPLAIYKMLFDLGVKNEFDSWRLFFEMPDADFARMVNCLEEVSDVNMSRKLTAIRGVSDGTQTERLAGVVTANEKYIQNRMLSYVMNNITAFDEPKK